LSGYYGLFFLAIGSFAPFSALWFESQNISSAVSGAIFAAPSIATSIFTLFIGSWADRLQDWRSVVVTGNWIVLIAISWILFGKESWDLLFV